MIFKDHCWHVVLGTKQVWWHTHRHFPELKLGLPEFNESLESESCSCWACFCCPETHPCNASQEVPLQGSARTSTNAWQMIIHFARLYISSKPQPNHWKGLEKLPVIPPLVALWPFGHPNFPQVYELLAGKPFKWWITMEYQTWALY